MRIYVGNVAYRLMDDELKEAFEAFGEVESAKIITDRETGRSKGFGFVEMTNDTDALAAINGLNGKELLDRSITVSEARPRPERSFH